MRNSIVIAAFILSLLVAFPAYGRSPSGKVQAIACAPGNPNVVAALIDETIWLTDDGGRSWSEIRLASLSDDINSGDLVNSPFTQFDAVSASIIPSDDSVTEYETQNFFLEEELPDVEPTFDGPSPPILAVSNGGAFALWLKDHLFQGKPSSTPSRLAGFDDVEGLLFDNSERLWIAESDRVSMVQKGSTRGTWPISEAGAPALSQGSDLLAVPASDGVWILDTSLPRPRTRLLRSGRANAVAGTSDGWYVFAAGRLVRMDLGGNFFDFGPIPIRPESLTAGNQGEIWARNSNNAWFKLEGRSWKRTEVGCVCADASGGIWTGTSLGPVGPKDMIERFEPTDSLAMLNIQSRASKSLYSQNPGPPRCRQMAFNPLPSASVSAGMGRGEYANIKEPGSLRQRGAHTWAYIGLKLVWSLQPMDNASCFAATENYRGVEDARRKRLQQLWLAWRNAEATAANATDPKKVIEAITNAKKLRELIRETSGTDPQKEEPR